MRTSICRASGAASLTILLALGLMAHASAQTLADFAEIQASPVVITPDASGRFAVLEVDTATDVACSVVYGTDTSFGQIAVDSDMDGGAHADHHPVMGGLEPGTDYVYRLQGTAADGSMYVSEVMTFTTPAAVAGPADLSLGAAVTGASSEWSDAFAAANAFDGDPTTQWSSRGDGDDAWVEIDLGEPQAIGKVVFRSRSMDDGTAITHTYTVSADGERFGPFEAEVEVPLQTTAQVLRFEVETSTGGNTGAIDIAILAEEAP
jgi:hypothetical protein